MAERDDRGIPGSGTVIAVAVVIALLASSGLVLWWKLRAAAPAGDAAPAETSLPAVRPLDSTMQLTIYLPAADSLAASSIPVKAQLDARSQTAEVIAAVLSEDRHDKGPVLSGVRLREVYLDAFGTAYLDLSIVPSEGIRSSAWDEMLAVAAITTSVMQNVAEIRQVRFLVDGKEAQTLSGHVDLTKRHAGRMDLVK